MLAPKLIEKLHQAAEIIVRLTEERDALAKRVAELERGRRPIPTTPEGLIKVAHFSPGAQRSETR